MHASLLISALYCLLSIYQVTQGFATLFQMHNDEQLLGDCERTWLEGNANILEVLPNEAAAERFASVNYESLVIDPKTSLLEVCQKLGVPFEPTMLQPYESEATKAFRKAETVFVGDFKLFKKAHIDAKQADKWKKVALPRALRPVTVALAHQLGYTEFPLWLPPELVWLRPPKLHSATPPRALLLCIHSGVGTLDLLEELASHLLLPSLGLRLTVCCCMLLLLLSSSEQTARTLSLQISPTFALLA